ncbi:O-antigen ligase family protein [Maribacter algicola]|uniref:O-antigen ligase family protein n=1 Tax=Meishania litoralis TaxID=3434685 RepID=A0ACC7LPJ6_9FLAO
MISLFKYFKDIGLPIIAFMLFFLIDPFKMGHLGGYGVTLLVLSKKELISSQIDADVVVLFFFSIVYAIFYTFTPDFSVQGTLFYVFFPTAFFLLGKYVVIKTRRVKDLYLFFFVVGFLFSLTALLSVGLNLIEGGFKQFERTIPLFWNGHLVSATLMGSFFTFNMCIPALLIVQQGKLNLIQKLVAMAIFVASLLCTFRLGSRTQSVIAVFLTVIALIYIIPRQSRDKNLRLIIMLGVVAIMVYLYVPLNLDADYLSVLGNRLDDSKNTASAGGRTERWTKSLYNLFRKPLGWSFEEFGYSHNLWLDVAQVTGLIPFFAVLFFTYKNIKKTIRAVLKRGGDLSFRTMILAFTISANLLFFVEPVMQGTFYMFVVYCFFQGAISKYYFFIEDLPVTGKEKIQSTSNR